MQEELQVDGRWMYTVYITNISSGGSRISQRGVAPIYYLAKFHWKLYETKKIGPRGGRVQTFTM